jgi:hypothetical protein
MEGRDRVEPDGLLFLLMILILLLILRAIDVCSERSGARS